MILDLAINEIKLLHRTKMGYLFVGVYMMVCSLLFWVIDNDYNIISSGIGDLRPFFELSPWLLAFLIPAISTKSFSDETQNGTLEILFSSPISLTHLVIGKFIGILSLILFTLLPLIVYFFAIQQLSEPRGYFDWMSHLSGLLSIFLVGTVYTGLSICLSILFRNSVLVVIIGVIACLFHYYGWFYIANLSRDFYWYQFIDSIGILNHYLSPSRGVLGVSDVFYFLFNTLLFLFFGISLLHRFRHR